MAKALAKEPEERYATCGELVEAAREALGLDDRPPTAASLSSCRRGRRSLPPARSAVGLIARPGKAEMQRQTLT